MRGKARFRAIMLTSITTVAGLYPLIFEKSLQAQFVIPMAISVAYGVLFGTAIILVNFPAIILVANDIRRLKKGFITLMRKGEWYLPSREEVEPAFMEKQRLKEKGHE